MKDFLSVFLTSDACGQCLHSRGNGIINNGKFYTSHNYIKKMTDNCVFFNIHMYNMAPNIKFIKEISKFVQVKNNIIRQEYYFNRDNDAVVKIILSNGGKNKETKEYKIKEGNKTVKWAELIQQKIPKKIENYIYFFPCFLFISKENWNNSITKNEELMAIPNSGLVKQHDDGKIALEKTRESIGKRNTTPENIIKELKENRINFEPHIKNKIKVQKDKKEKYKANVAKKFNFTAYDSDI
jgi:hypothetical protein